MSWDQQDSGQITAERHWWSQKSSLTITQSCLAMSLTFITSLLLIVLISAAAAFAAWSRLWVLFLISLLMTQITSLFSLCRRRWAFAVSLARALPTVHMPLFPATCWQVRSLQWLPIDHQLKEYKNLHILALNLLPEPLSRPPLAPAISSYWALDCLLLCPCPCCSPHWGHPPTRSTWPNPTCHSSSHRFQASSSPAFPMLSELSWVSPSLSPHPHLPREDLSSHWHVAERPNFLLGWKNRGVQ